MTVCVVIVQICSVPVVGSENVTENALDNVAEVVLATGLDISLWPPGDVRGLILEIGLLLILFYAIMRLTNKESLALAQTIVEAGTNHISERTRERTALANKAEAEAEALERIKFGRRSEDA